MMSGGCGGRVPKSRQTATTTAAGAMFEGKDKKQRKKGALKRKMAKMKESTYNADGN